MSIEECLTDLRQDADFMRHVTAWQEIPARSGIFKPFPSSLEPRLTQALHKRGVHALYSHQAEAVDAAQRGENPVIVTATASGKTLCYNLPVLDTLLRQPQARALYLFPTKALAQDQLAELNDLLHAASAEARPAQPLIGVATYDGDTPRGQRGAIRSRARLLLTNPDMLHMGILPYHTQWAAFLGGLRWVVVDEMHTYRGVFGSHVANVLRRLRRMCAHYGSAPQFICCSATSANPREHIQALIGAPVTLVEEDGAPQGSREFVLWNPPVIEDRGRRTEDGGRSMFSSSVFRLPSDSGRRRSTNIETANLLAALVRAGVKTLAFTRTRRGAELVLRYTREALSSVGGNLETRVAAYRAGYTPEERRRLERAFLSGELLGLVSTNALELGVDIGGVDAVLIGGFPGTVASAWQQAGRVAWLLHAPDFATAAAVAGAINREFGEGVALARDAQRVEVTIPAALGALDLESGRLYLLTLRQVLRPALRALLEALMVEKTPFGELEVPEWLYKAEQAARQKGLDEGVEKGLAQSILTVLSARGLTLSDAEREKVLTARPVDAPADPDITVERVARDDDDARAAFDAVATGGWELDPAPFIAYHRILLDDPAGAATLYLARWRGEPAATALHLRIGRTIFLVAGVVLPAHRGRGLYRALVAARLRDAASEDRPLAITLARASTSAPILDRLGFVTVSEATSFGS